MRALNLLSAAIHRKLMFTKSVIVCSLSQTKWSTEKEPGLRGSDGDLGQHGGGKPEQFLTKKLELQHTVEVERAHRAGKPDGGDERSRPIIAGRTTALERQRSYTAAGKVSQRL